VGEQEAGVRSIKGLETSRRKSGISSAFREIEELEAEIVNAELEEGTGDLIVPVEYKLVKNLGRNVRLRNFFHKISCLFIDRDRGSCPTTDI